jgi:hypothetical protein
MLVGAGNEHGIDAKPLHGDPELTDTTGGQGGIGG